MLGCVKQPLYDLNKVVKAVKSKTVSCWNHLKQIQITIHTMRSHLSMQVKTSPEGEMDKDQNI